MLNRTDDQIAVFASSETDEVKSVLMRLAAPIDYLSMIPAMLEMNVMRQIWRNRFVPYSLERAQAQQLALKDVLEAHGTRVYLDAPLRTSTAHYTRDVGFVVDDTFFVSRMGSRAREKEIPAMDPWTSRFSKVERIDTGRIEGGDVMLTSGRVLVGLGEATSTAGVESFTRALARSGNTREVVPLAFTSPGVIHLDTKFNIVAPDLAVISRSSFEESSLKWLEEHFDLIDATPVETRAIHINTFAIGNNRVVMDARAERLANVLRSYKLDPILLDYSEITRLPGSFRCTTLPLERSSD